jgi:hypothetical protein
MLAAESQHDAVTAHRDVAFRQRRDSERLRLARIAFGADAEPTGIDEAQCNGRDSLAIQSFFVEMLRHRRA